MRGRVTFEVAGQEYALRFTTNRLCDLEEDAGESITQLGERLEEPGAITFTDLRRIFRAGLVGEFSHAQAGDLLDAIGLQEGLMLAMKALGAAFDIKVEDGKPGKPKAGAV